MMRAYQIDQTYRWNYDHPPRLTSVEIPRVQRPCRLFGRQLGTPLGVAAGPLLNGQWVRYYASLGFDFLTYKTVRSVARDCYPLPNLLPVQTHAMNGHESAVPASPIMNGTWAVSFGMPSQTPLEWRQDVRQTRAALPPDKLLSVSVVGSAQADWSLEQLADDYARCAEWAVEAGADCVELNFSCPNVATCDGQLYQQPAAAAQVAERVRQAIGDTPLLIKIGHFVDEAHAVALVRAIDATADAIVTTNSISARVRTLDGKFQFDGERRGICGDATREASLAQTRCLASAIGEASSMVLIGVGGIRTAEHVQQYLQAGASAVQIATEAMRNPRVAIEIRREWQTT